MWRRAHLLPIAEILPLDQQAVVVMMRNMFQLMVVFGFIEGLVLNLPATFGHAEQGACADLLGR